MQLTPLLPSLNPPSDHPLLTSLPSYTDDPGMRLEEEMPDYELEVTVSLMVSAQHWSDLDDPHEVARSAQERWTEDPNELAGFIAQSEDFDLQVRPLRFQQ